MEAAHSEGWVKRTRVILEMIKFEHTLFALPFAFIGMLLAARAAHLPSGLPPLATCGWIIVAMVGARSAAMTFNRIVDAKFDAQNPRTANRAIPAGQVSMAQAWVFTLISAGMLVLAAWRLNPLCLALSPVALFAVLGYSYTKRFTSLCHLWLGAAIGLSPLGAWIAVSGSFGLPPLLLTVAVMCWIAGFDIIYALQDADFDRSAGLRSIPARLGPAKALGLSRLLHLLMLVSLCALGAITRVGIAYWVGVGLVAILIGYEQSLVKPDDLSKVNLAFFTLNGWISVTLFVSVLTDGFLAR